MSEEKDVADKFADLLSEQCNKQMSTTAMVVGKYEDLAKYVIDKLAEIIKSQGQMLHEPFPIPPEFIELAKSLTKRTNNFLRNQDKDEEDFDDEEGTKESPPPPENGDKDDA